MSIVTSKGDNRVDFSLLKFWKLVKRIIIILSSHVPLGQSLEEIEHPPHVPLGLGLEGVNTHPKYLWD